MKTLRSLLLLIVAVLIAGPVLAKQQPPGQGPPPEQGPPPSFAPEQLDQMVSRVALYPDPLLSQVLAAATFPDQIPEAARWADQRPYLTGQPLQDAMQHDQLPW